MPSTRGLISDTELHVLSSSDFGLDCLLDSVSGTGFCLTKWDLWFPWTLIYRRLKLHLWCIISPDPIEADGKFSVSLSIGPA